MSEEHKEVAPEPERGRPTRIEKAHVIAALDAAAAGKKTKWRSSVDEACLHEKLCLFPTSMLLNNPHINDKEQTEHFKNIRIKANALLSLVAPKRGSKNEKIANVSLEEMSRYIYHVSHPDESYPSILRPRPSPHEIYRSEIQMALWSLREAAAELEKRSSAEKLMSYRLTDSSKKARRRVGLHAARCFAECTGLKATNSSPDAPVVKFVAALLKQIDPAITVGAEGVADWIWEEARGPVGKGDADQPELPQSTWIAPEK
jgi:hypothetical protein